MACVSPNKVFYIGVNNDTGKRKIAFASHKATYVVVNSDGYTQYYDDVPDTRFLHGGTVFSDCDTVPCGQCIGCRLDYSREWATRLMLEMKRFKESECWFITFTYDDEFLPVSKFIFDSKTRKVKRSPFHSVSKKTHQLLMKRIRNWYGPDIRFFSCGEYGDISFRPHYHYILFGLDLSGDIMEFYRTNWRGDILYNSPTFQRKVWSDEKTHKPYGHVVIGKVSFDSCAYVARYVMKKRKGLNSDWYKKMGIEPEFCCMSRKPGLGKDYFDVNYEFVYSTDEIVLPGHDGAFIVKPPSYFDYLCDKNDFSFIDDVKQARRDVAEGQKNFRSLHRPFISDDDIFSAQSRAYENKLTIRKRGEV